MPYRIVLLRQGLLLLLSVALIAGISLVVLRACEQIGDSVAKPLGRQMEAGLRETVRRQLAFDPRFHEIKQPALSAAMETIRSRLKANAGLELEWPVEIVVVSNNDVNAVTLPGGLILVYQGLLRDAQSAEEVAAVIAHEMGHIVHHDIMNALGRNLAIAAVLAGSGTASPQVVQEILQTLTESAFSRAAETDADVFACQLLTASSIRPAHLADFFKRLEAVEEKSSFKTALTWINSHPDTVQRSKAVEAADSKFSGLEQPLGIDWAAIKQNLQ